MLLMVDNISIRYKLIFIQTLASVLVVSIFFGIFTITDINQYKARKLKSMLGLAQVIGTNNIPSLRFNDDESAKEDLSRLRTIAPEVMQAWLIDSSLKTFAWYGKPGESMSHPLNMGRNDHFFEKKSLWVFYPVMEGNSKLGKVVMKVDLEELRQLIRSKYKLAVLLLLGAVGLSLLLAITFQKYISSRLLKLANRMKEVSETGNYSLTLDTVGKDEISTLVKGFNNLMLQVQENQKRKDEFIGIASHELKTPLTSIKGYIQLLQDLEDRQPQKQFVQKASDNVAKLERLIADLLDVSRIQSGQLQLNLQEFSLDQLVEETISNFQLIAHNHEVVRLTPPIDIQITGDKQRIEQVLLNLLSNAVKYSPEGKKVLVSVFKKEEEIIIKVRDFGVGIPADEQQNIFERFYRTRGTSRTISGFGLGLYISQDIIKRHKGRIWVESEEKGSSFYIALPLNTKNKKALPEKLSSVTHEKDLSS